MEMSENREIEKILLKNRIIESFSFWMFIVLLAMLSLAFIIKNMLYQIIVIVVFFFGLVILLILGAEITSLKFSEVLGYYLDKLSSRINKHSTEEDVSADGKRIIRTASKLIDEYLVEGKSKKFLVFGFDTTEKVLRKLQKNLRKAYTFFDCYSENEKHKESLEKNFRRISDILKEEKEFLRKEESIIDELEKLPILEQEMTGDRFIAAKILLKRYTPYRVLVFSAIVLLITWKIVPYYYPEILSLENQILLTITLIGTAIIEDVKLFKQARAE